MKVFQASRSTGVPTLLGGVPFPICPEYPDGPDDSVTIDDKGDAVDSCGGDVTGSATVASAGADE